MKLFPQLALVSAIAISGNAMAMQALDDSALSAATGQEGITVTITPGAGGITIDQLVVNDADGRTGNTLTGQAGSITLGRTTGPALGSDFRLDTTGITLVIDADGNGTAPVLNVGVTLGAATIVTGDIGVAVGNATGSATRQATTVTILDSLTINLGDTDLNIQLGNEVQGAMIKVDATVAGGITISDFALNDANSGGSIAIGSIKVTDANETFLTIDADIDVEANGLVITTNGGPMDVLLDEVKLGDNTVGNTTPVLGNVGLFGLDMSGTTITVSGH